jgi:hypothetical protein
MKASAFDQEIATKSPPVESGNKSPHSKLMRFFKSRRLRRWLILSLSSLALLYCLGYGWCRLNKFIVHYTASVDGKCTFHDVDSGDVKMASPAPIFAALYTPLRYLEIGFWKMRKPAGSSC